MITNEIKARIFAMYLGQEFYQPASKYPDNGYFFITGSTIHLIIDQHSDFRDISILLKPLSAITDEDAIEISVLGGLSGKLAVKEYVVNAGKSLVLNYINKQTNVYGKDWLRIFQYLQSKGYALPYMEYSVEDLVKAGIYKLEE